MIFIDAYIALSFAAALIITVVFFFISVKKDGDPFEKAYDITRRQLLNDAKDKPKGKGKTNKKKKEGKKAITAGSANEVSSEEKGETEDDVPEQKVEEEPKESQEESPVADKKQNKKNKNKKRKSSVEAQAPEVQALEEVAVKIEEKPQAAAVPEPEKKKKPKKRAVINIAELDTNKVLTRIANVDEIEPEYVSYLSSYFHNSTGKTKAQLDQIAKLKEQQEATQAQLDQMSAAKAASDKNNHEKQRLVVDLTAKLQLLQRAEEEAQKKLISAQQSQTDSTQLRRELEQANALKAKFQADSTKAQEEQTVLQTKIAQLQKELEVQSQTNKLLANDLQQVANITANEAELDKLKTQLDQFEKAAKAVTSQVAEKDATIGHLRASLAEKDELKKQHAAEQKEWNTKEARLMTQYVALQTLVAELNEEIAKFETFKKEQDELRNKLVAKDQELEEKRRKLAEAEIIVNGGSVDSAKLASLEQENAQLKQKVDQLLTALENAKHQHSEELLSLRGAQSSAQEEIVILKKANSLNAAPAATPTNNAEVGQLKDEIQKLQAKNDELRARNFAILEKVESGAAKTTSTSAPAKTTPVATSSSSADVEAERALVVKILGDVVDKKLSNTSDAKAFSAWLSLVSESIKKSQAASSEDKENAGSKKESKKAKKQQVIPSTEAPTDVEVYKAALTNLTKELSRIERIALSREADYEQKLSELKDQLEKSELKVNISKRLIDEMRQCSKIRK